jgi:two-component system OmpR family response regulator
METPPAIAIVEDDPEIRSLVSGYLARERFEPIECRNGAELDAVLARRHVDLIVLDLMMPGEDGLSICRRIAEARRAPILILSAKGDDIDRIIGLEVGADDYLAKPFNPRELVARIRAVLRRGAAPLRDTAETPAEPEANDGAPREIYRFAGWRLDVDARSLKRSDGATVPLSGGEFALLVAFTRRPRRVLSREQLIEWTRGPDSESFDRAVDVQLSRLRRKLGDDTQELIKTIRGDGYLFAADVRREGEA